MCALWRRGLGRLEAGLLAARPFGLVTVPSVGSSPSLPVQQPQFHRRKQGRRAPHQAHVPHVHICPTGHGSTPCEGCGTCSLHRGLGPAAFGVRVGRKRGRKDGRVCLGQKGWPRCPGLRPPGTVGSLQVEAEPYPTQQGRPGWLGASFTSPYWAAGLGMRCSRVSPAHGTEPWGRKCQWVQASSPKLCLPSPACPQAPRPLRHPSRPPRLSPCQHGPPRQDTTDLTTVQGLEQAAVRGHADSSGLWAPWSTATRFHGPTPAGITRTSVAVHLLGDV